LYAKLQGTIFQTKDIFNFEHQENLKSHTISSSLLGFNTNVTKIDKYVAEKENNYFM
jgi:hypothetical protein